ncbi:MAG: hypothetical protein IPJ32_21960 [Sphingobacteriaceae bacterium]|nr:hypothetical protein [Sphingobacteriaceae bacterium]
MDTTKTTTSTTQQFLIIALIVLLLACIALFSLDKDTNSFNDLLKPGNLFVLVLYFTPDLLN